MRELPPGSGDRPGDGTGPVLLCGCHAAAAGPVAGGERLAASGPPAAPVHRGGCDPSHEPQRRIPPAGGGGAADLGPDSHHRGAENPALLPELPGFACRGGEYAGVLLQGTHAPPGLQSKSLSAYDREGGLHLGGAGDQYPGRGSRLYAGPECQTYPDGGPDAHAADLRPESDAGGGAVCAGLAGYGF